jgi:hypothetical protein
MPEDQASERSHDREVREEAPDQDAGLDDWTRRQTRGVPNRWSASGGDDADR